MAAEEWPDSRSAVEDKNLDTVSKLQSNIQDIQSDPDEIVYNSKNDGTNTVKLNPTDYEEIIKSLSEENKMLKETFYKLTENASHNDRVYMQDILNELIAKHKMYISMAVRIEQLERIVNDDILHKVDYQSELIQQEKNKNSELKDILKLAMNTGKSKSNENMIKKFSEKIQEKQKEIDQLKAEIPVLKQPAKFMNIMHSLQKNYATQRLENVLIKNELDALKREWSIIFKKPAFIQPDTLDIDEEHISSLLTRINELECESEKLIKKFRQENIDYSSKIHFLEKELANERIRYEILLTNRMLMDKESHKIVEDIVVDIITSVQGMNAGKEMINNNVPKIKDIEKESSKEDRTEKISNGINENALKNSIQEFLPIIEQLCMYSKNLEIAAKSSNLEHTMPKENEIIENIIRVQKYQLQTLLELLKVQIGQEVDENQLTSWNEMNSYLQKISLNLTELDEIEKLHFTMDLIEEFRLLCERLTVIDTRVNDFLEYTTELNSLLDESLALDFKKHFLAGCSVQIEKWKIDQIKDDLLYLYNKFTQLSQFGKGESKIMNRFKVEMQAMHTIYNRILKNEGCGPSSLFKTNMDIRRLTENLKKVMKEINLIHFYENSLYTDQKVVTDRKRLESQVREMELLTQIECHKMIVLKDAIERAEQQISENEIANSHQGQIISRDLYASLTTAELKRNTLRIDLDKGRFQMKTIWFEMGKQWFVEKSLREEPRTIEALRVHLEKALEDEMRTRLDLENEKASRKKFEELMLAIYLDMERVAIKGKEMLQPKPRYQYNGCMPCSCTFFTKLAKNFNRV